MMERVRAHRWRQGHRRLLRGLSTLLSLALATTLLAALPLTSPADAQNRHFYGVVSQGPLVTNDYNLMQTGRVGTLRFLISWRTVETMRGQYSWERPDQVIGHTAVRGIRVLPFVHGEPPDHVNNPPTEASDRRAFRRFMAALARRYGHGGTFWHGPYQRLHGSNAPRRPVRAWQIFNEQNGRFFWGGTPSPRAYGRLLKMGARGIRSRTPRAEIVLGGMFASPSGRGSMTSWRFLSRLYQVKRVKRFFDTVAVHPYAPNLRGIRVQMRLIRKVMRRNNDHRGLIRVTELGWGSHPTGHPLTKTPQEQARMLRRSFWLMARQRHRRGWNVRSMTWFSWQDGDHCPFCASSGLFSGPVNNRTPKPSWEAFRQVTRPR